MVLLKLLCFLNILLCNSNLVKGTIFKNGMWQDLPLSCYTCKGSDCAAPIGIIETIKCPENINNCITAFDENGKVIQRDCFSNIDEDNCKAPNSCFDCKSNKCNIGTAINEYIDCVDCNSNEDLNCVNSVDKVTATRKCYKQCMVALYHLKENFNATFEIVRTCLDDKEIKDQNECSETTEVSSCKSCDSSNCNSIDFPKDRLKCFHCNSEEECKNPDMKYCPLYHKDDECIAKYKDSKVVAMGCKSILSEISISEMLLENRLYICKGEGCNALDKLPTLQKCAACTSIDDKNCATNPEKLIADKNCDKIPNTNCYSKVNSDGATERGCWTDLNKENRLNCLQNNTQCEICDRNGCNNQIFPKNRRQCYVCNSEDDKNCELSPDRNVVCEPFVEKDRCITKLINNVTHRNCESRESCNGLDRLSCKACQEDNCNIVNLKNLTKDNENHGIWQDLPVKCLICNDEASCKNLTNGEETCSETLEECMTVFNHSGSVIRRGCTQYVENKLQAHCAKNPELCFSCKSNKCNIAMKTDEYIDCHYCGWPNSPKCLEDIDEKNNFPLRRCYKKCMTSLFLASEDARSENYDLIRTCLDDKEEVQQQECNNENNCNSCEESKCNNKIFNNNWTKCYQCSNVKDCKNSVSKLCPSYRDNDECYFLYSNTTNADLIQSGCKSSLSSKIVEELLKENKIAFCTGMDCNSLDKIPQTQICSECDSKTDEKCAENPPEIKTNVTCKAPNSKCYVKVDTDGFNQRGCYISLGDDMENCKGDDICQNCYGENCNQKVFPENRQKCYICDSKIDKNCEAEPKNIKICPKYKKGEKCIAKYTDGRTERGCEQSLVCDDPANDKICQICDDANCNTVNLKERNGSSVLLNNFVLIILLVFASVLLL